MNIISGHAFIFQKYKKNSETFDVVVNVVRDSNVSALLAHNTESIYVVLYNVMNSQAMKIFKLCKGDHINELDPLSLSLMFECFGLPVDNDSRHLILSFNDFEVFNFEK